MLDLSRAQSVFNSIYPRLPDGSVKVESLQDTLVEFLYSHAKELYGETPAVR